MGLAQRKFNFGGRVEGEKEEDSLLDIETEDEVTKTEEIEIENADKAKQETGGESEAPTNAIQSERKKKGTPRMATTKMYKLAQIAKMTRIPYPTLQRYLRREDVVAAIEPHTEGEGRGRLYGAAVLDIFKEAYANRAKAGRPPGSKNKRNDGSAALDPAHRPITPKKAFTVARPIPANISLFSRLEELESALSEIRSDIDLIKESIGL